MVIGTRTPKTIHKVIHELFEGFGLYVCSVYLINYHNLQLKEFFFLSAVMGCPILSLAM